MDRAEEVADVEMIIQRDRDSRVTYCSGQIRDCPARGAGRGVAGPVPYGMFLGHLPLLFLADHAEAGRRRGAGIKGQAVNRHV